MAFLLPITLHPPPVKVWGWPRRSLEALQWGRFGHLLCLCYRTWSRKKMTLWGIELHWFTGFKAKSATVNIWTCLLNVAGEGPVMLSPCSSQGCLLSLVEAWNEGLQLQLFSRTSYQWLLPISQQRGGASFPQILSKNFCLKSSTSWKKKEVIVLQGEWEWK